MFSATIGRRAIIPASRRLLTPIGAIVSNPNRIVISQKQICGYLS